MADPNLQLFSGPQYPAAGKPNFGIFLDSSPDRWRKLLMRKREPASARVEGRKGKSLSELDYLLGVYDGHRMGGLRFKKSQAGNFLNDDKEMASPPWANLRDLEYASLQLEKEDAIDDPAYMKWLSLLIAPGSSLGGARPKASAAGLNSESKKEASAITEKVEQVVNQWKPVATSLQIPREEQELMADAFFKKVSKFKLAPFPYCVRFLPS